MLQQPKPGDYVIATGVKRTVREVIDIVLRQVGITLQWRGEGVEEVGIVADNSGDFDLKVGSEIVTIDPRYFRPAEVEYLCGDARLAMRELGWRLTRSLEQLAREMDLSDLEIARRYSLVSSDKIVNASYGQSLYCDWW